MSSSLRLADDLTVCAQRLLRGTSTMPSSETTSTKKPSQSMECWVCCAISRPCFNCRSAQYYLFYFLVFQRFNS